MSTNELTTPEGVTFLERTGLFPVTAHSMFHADEFIGGSSRFAAVQDEE